MEEKSQKQTTHIAVTIETQRKLSILKSVQGPKVYIYELVGAWTDEAWEKAKKAGLVTDAMLKTQLNPPSEKKNTARKRADRSGGITR